MADAEGVSALRRAAILEAATGVFLRYGFKKTSMDDLARAAGLSRQGLYLHFATKEGLFKAALLQLVDAVSAACRAALAREDLDVETRLLGAFEALHGQAIGQAGREHMSELLETTVTLVGPVVSDMEQGFVTDLVRVIKSAGVAARWRGAGVSAKDLADQLFTMSYGVKHRVSTPAEYRDRMRVALKIVCRGAG